MAYATVANIQARNPYVKITTYSEPTSSEVQIWIDDAEAMVNGALSAAQLTSPCVNANGIKILRQKVTTYVSALVARAYSAAGGDVDVFDTGDIDERWEAFLIDVVAESTKWGSMLEGGSAGTAARKLRSHTTHNQDGLTVSNGDFDPEYEKGDPL